MSRPVKYHGGLFPPENLDFKKLVPLIGPANAALARYDGLLVAMPNAQILLSPLTTQEAVLSSKIEGTQATMGEVLEYEANGKNGSLQASKDEDIQEILNYRKAMNNAVENLKTIPLCQRIIQDCHEILLDSVRGHGKSPGEYRKVPNWIGPKGSSIETASYIPISVEKLSDAMSKWEKFIHEPAPDKLIQLALLHAEFEAIHPFLDGNGRLGRMFVPLFLYQAKMIRQPIFYISAYLDKNREEYYEKLLEISKNNNWTKFCEFFLRGIQIQAEENLQKAQDIINLYSKMKNKLLEITRSQYAIHTLDWIFAKPIFKSSDFINQGNVPKPTAQRLINLLKKEAIIKELREAKGSRAATLVYAELINIAEGYEAF